MREFDMDELETIVITFDDGEEGEFYVLEQARIMETNYYLVAPADEEETDSDELECNILKENTDEKDSDYGMYEFVEDEKELAALSVIFDELLED